MCKEIKSVYCVVTEKVCIEREKRERERERKRDRDSVRRL